MVIDFWSMAHHVAEIDTISCEAMADLGFETRVVGDPKIDMLYHIKFNTTYIIFINLNISIQSR